MTAATSRHRYARSRRLAPLDVAAFDGDLDIQLAPAGVDDADCDADYLASFALSGTIEKFTRDIGRPKSSEQNVRALEQTRRSRRDESRAGRRREGS